MGHMVEYIQDHHKMAHKLVQVQILLLEDTFQLEVQRHKQAFQNLQLPFQVLYIQLLCKQYNLVINLLNVLVFHYHHIFGISPKVLLHNKDHHIIYNLLKVLFLVHGILGMVDNELE